MCGDIKKYSAAFVLAFAAIVALQSPACAQSAAAPAKANVRIPIQLTKQSDLDFGNVITRPTAGTVTINAQTGVRTTSGPVLVSGTTSRAQFSGSGTKGQLVTVTATPGTITLNRIGGGATMTVNALRISVNGGTPRALGRNVPLSAAAGVVDIKLGGRLNVRANQLDGQYEGNFTLTMNYQ
jgi:hypothetical protein